jgi:hypothetical protein
LIAAGFCAGAASWLATAMWARRRARDLERLGLDSEQWHSLATKDTLTGVLFLCLAVASVAEAWEGQTSGADPWLALVLLPLIVSLVWSRRFVRYTRRQAVESDIARREQERRKHEEQFTERLTTLLKARDLNLPSGAAVRTLYEPAQGVLGGDFLATIEYSYDLLFAVGDVTGHGFGAAVEAMRVRDLMVAALRAGDELTRVVRLVNSYLCTSEFGESLATLFVGCYSGNELRYVSGGHVPALVVEPDSVRELLPTGSILGMDADVPIAEEKTSLSSGTRVVVFTDGLTEAYGGRGGLDIDEIGTITRAEGLGGLHTAVLTRQPEVVRDDIAVIELVVP